MKQSTLTLLPDGSPDMKSMSLVAKEMTGFVESPEKHMDVFIVNVEDDKYAGAALKDVVKEEIIKFGGDPETTDVVFTMLNIFTIDDKLCIFCCAVYDIPEESGSYCSGFRY